VKVGIVTPYYHPHPGGVEVYASNTAQRLQKLGWDVFVVTTSGRASQTTVTTQDGIKVYRLGYRIKLSNTPIGFRWRHEIERILAAEKPDVINAHTPVPYFADLVERVRGTIPFVLTYHNDLVKEHFPQNIFARLIHWSLTAGTLRRADRIIATSSHYINSSRYLRPYKHKISVVPPGVDATIFNSEVDCTEVRKMHKGKRIILFVGSISKQQAYKGLEELIKSLVLVKKKVPNAQLVVAGRGDGKEHYEEIAQAAGVLDDVAFVGYKTQAELAAYNVAAGVQVLPSTNGTEGFGMVLIEAGACGTPVVGTNVGGIPFAVEENVNGLLVPPRDINALAKAITRVLTDSDLAKRLGDGGIARSRAMFDWDDLAEQTSQALSLAQRPSIVHVAGYYPPHLGGMEKVAKALADRLALQDYDTHVLTSDIPKDAPALPTRPNLSVKRLKAFEFAHTPVAFGFIPAILKIPKRSVVHLHLAQAFYPELVWLASKLRGNPYIVHFHLDLMPSGALGKLFLVYKALVIRTVIRGAAKVAVFSAEQQQFIHKKYGVPLSRIVVIPNGVDEAFFAEAKTYGKSREFNIVYAGRLSAQKCVDRLVAAMSLIKTPAKLTLVGDGEMREALQQQARALKLTNVTFEGYKSAAEMRDYFAKADVFAISSDREGMPLVVLEAMASALPIVGSNVTGTRELISGVGVLVDDVSPKGFAEALDTVLADPARLAELSRSSLAAAKTYTWSRVLEDFKKVYTEVAK
jgi:glycosyltransferase involved in cell wall biosynthesis